MKILACANCSAVLSPDEVYRGPDPKIVTCSKYCYYTVTGK